MATIAQIEQQLLLYSSTGNRTAFLATMNSITASQLPLVSIAVWSGTLNNITSLFDAKTASAMTRDMMSKAGAYVSADSVGIAIYCFAVDSNYAALDAVTDYLTATQKTALGGLYQFHLNQTLEHLANKDMSTPTDDALIAGVVRDFMSKLGAQTSADVIGGAIAQFAQNINYAALDAVTDYLTATQKTALGGLYQFHLNETLTHLAYQDIPGSTADNALIAGVVRDFMSKLGAQTDALVIGSTFYHFAWNANFLALDAVTDYLTAAQKTALNGSYYLNDVLTGLLINNMNVGDALIASTVRDFMSKLGAQTPINAIERAIDAFSWGHNYGALDAVTDYLTAEQKTALNGSIYLKDALDGLTNGDIPGTATDDALIAGVVRDFMSKLGAQTDAAAIGNAIWVFANNVNYGALDAVTDYLTAGQKTALTGSSYVGDALYALVGLYSQVSEATTAATVRDFMSKLGAQITDPRPLSYAIDIFAWNHNYAALDAATDYLTAAQKTALTGDVAVADALHQLALADASTDDALIGGVTRDFMSKLAAQVTNTGIIGDAIEQFAESYNLYALDSMLDYTTLARIDSGTRTALTSAGYSLKTDGVDNVVVGTSTIVLAMGGNDTVQGNAADDIIFGGAGNDVLYGNAGYDYLFGGIGNDTLTGGAGTDRFVFDNMVGVDAVTDFSAAQDYLDLSVLLDAFDPVTQAVTDFVKTGTDVNGRVTLSVDLDGTGAGAAVQIATIAGVSSLNIQSLYDTGHILV